MPTELPSLVGRYRISAHLAGDVVDDVYQGFDPLIERPVAVRVFRLQVAAAAAEQAVKQTFYQEMQRAGALMHHGIATLFDAGEVPGLLFMATEFAEATRLSSLLDDGLDWDLPDRMSLLSQIVDALEYARELGMPHLNLRPTNVLVGADRGIKIAGFGVAPVIVALAAASGTPMPERSRYAASERVRGELGDHRSDVFSLARIACDLLGAAGAPQGDARTPGYDERALPSHLADLGVSAERWSAVFDRALAADPAERFETAAELEVELLLMLGVSAPNLRKTGTPLSPRDPIPTDVPHGTPDAKRRPEPENTHTARGMFSSDLDHEMADAMPASGRGLDGDDEMGEQTTHSGSEAIRHKIAERAADQKRDEP